jgi:anti-sigma regulatory factor (Ser/Thr protein kinase)
MSTRRFGYALDSVAEARLYVRQALEDQPRELVDVAELLTSELATNAIIHAASSFELEIDVDRKIRVEVRDTGGGRPAVLHAGPHDGSGRGLSLVQALSSAWGIIPSPPGKTVWYELPLASEQHTRDSAAAGRRGRRQEKLGGRVRDLCRALPAGAERRRAWVERAAC